MKRFFLQGLSLFNAKMIKVCGYAIRRSKGRDKFLIITAVNHKDLEISPP
jgi:hypothetical protein